MRSASLIAGALLLTSIADGAPTDVVDKTDVILSLPSRPMDEGRIEQALKRLEEELAKASTSSEDSGFDGEDLSTQQIKSLMQKGDKGLPTADVRTTTPLKNLLSEDEEKQTEASELDAKTEAQELTPFQSPPMSYLKESVGDEDHEFFFEDPRRNAFSEPSFRDVFDDVEEKKDDDDDDDDEDDDEDSSDDVVFRSNDRTKSSTVKTDKGSRADDSEKEHDGYFVEPHVVISEPSNKREGSEELVSEKDVMYVFDDVFLRPKEIHKYSDGSSFELHTPELLADLGSSSDVTYTAGDMAPTQPGDNGDPSTVAASSSASGSAEILQASTTVPGASTTPTTSPAAASSSVLLETTPTTSITMSPTTTSHPSEATEHQSKIGVTDTLKAASAETTTSSTLTTVVIAEAAYTTERFKASVTEKPASVSTSTVKPTTGAPSTVQKIPQFIKSIYEAATQKLPSFIHAQGVDAGLLAPSKHSANLTFFSSGAGSSSPGNSGSAISTASNSSSGSSHISSVAVASSSAEAVALDVQSNDTNPLHSQAGQSVTGEHSQTPEGSHQSHNGQAGQTRRLAIELCLFRRLCLQSRNFLEKHTSQTSKSGNNLIDLEEVSDENSASENEDEELDDEDDDTGDQKRYNNDSVGRLTTTTNAPAKASTEASNFATRKQTTPPELTSLNLPFDRWSPQDLAFLQQIVKLDSTTEFPGSVAEALAANGTLVSKVPSQGSPSAEPTQEVQFSTSSPQDTPLGTLVKGTACEGQTMSKLDKIIEHFPSRLPELHEFKRRRFLRAAVIGGLHTLRSTQRNVTCNLTSKTTHWGYRLRGQLDGILNLGITGLPRMYLRYTGPLTVKITMSALNNETRPVIDQVTVEESKVEEIHYQSVLGFEQPFVERATKYLLQRAMKEEIIDPITNALLDELQNPKPDKSKVLLLDDLRNTKKY